MPFRNLLKYLYIPGLILTSAGLVVGLLSTSSWPVLAIGLLIGGGAILAIWLGFILVTPQGFLVTPQGFWGKRSTQVGTNALVATLSVLAILGLINFLAVRYLSPIDLTENQLFTLSPQTQEIVRNLKEPMKIWVFDPAPNSTDKELLKRYKSYSPYLEFEFVDPDKFPLLVQRFNAKSVGDVYLEYRDKKQLVQTLVLYENKEPLSEIKLSNAIEKIQRDRNFKVYFLQGHGEHPLKTGQGGLSEAVSSLQEKGYIVEPLNLAQTPKIPADADVIIIAGPERKLFPQEVKALKQFSDQGGSLFVLLNPTVEEGLESLWKEWGIELDSRIIIDGSGAGNLIGLGPATPIINTYGDHPITKDFNNGLSFYPLARPIGTAKIDGVTAVALIVTSDKMWGESDLASEEVSFDKTKDIPGPLDIGVALTRKENKTTPSPSPSVKNSPQPENKTTPTPTPSVSVSPTVTPSEKTTPTPTPSVSVSPSVTPSEKTTPTPTPSVSVSPSVTPSETPSPTPTPSVTSGEIQPTPSPKENQNKQTEKESKETSPTPLEIPQTPSPTPTASNLVDPEQEVKVDPTPTPQTSPEKTSTPTPTPTPTPSQTIPQEDKQQTKPLPTVSLTPTPTPTPTSTPTSTPTPTPNPSVSPETKSESKMVVIGNSTFATNGLFDQQLNGDVFLNSVQWLASDDQEALSIRPKEVKNRRITLSQLQAGLIFWLSIVIFPLTAFILAGVTWWKRR